MRENDPIEYEISVKKEITIPALSFSSAFIHSPLVGQALAATVEFLQGSISFFYRAESLDLLENQQWKTNVPFRWICGTFLPLKKHIFNLGHLIKHAHRNVCVCLYFIRPHTHTLEQEKERERNDLFLPSPATVP